MRGEESLGIAADGATIAYGVNHRYMYIWRMEGRGMSAYRLSPHLLRHMQ